jgi:ABC-2 type transport system permease protein
MTFLQQTLGRNYKWWYIIIYAFKTSSGHLQAFLFNSTLTTFEFLAFIYIWKLNGSFPEIITYLAIGRVFDRLLFNEADTQINYMVWRGVLSRYLLLPTNYFGILFFDNIGFNFIRALLNSLLTLGFALLLFTKDIVLSQNIIFLFPFFVISYLILNYISCIKGSIAFWVHDNSNSTSTIKGFNIAIGMLSGAVIPLFILFSGFWNPIFWTPFAFLLHHPMQIYLGKYSQVEIMYTFAGGIAWCLVLWILARLVFKAGLKRNEAVGL